MSKKLLPLIQFTFVISLILSGCTLPIQPISGLEGCQFKMIDNLRGGYRCENPGLSITIWNTGYDMAAKYDFVTVKAHTEDSAAEAAIYAETLCHAEASEWSISVYDSQNIVTSRWLPKDCMGWITSQIYRMNRQYEHFEQAQTLFELLSSIR